MDGSLTISIDEYTRFIKFNCKSQKKFIYLLIYLFIVNILCRVE